MKRIKRNLSKFHEMFIGKKRGISTEVLSAIRRGDKKRLREQWRRETTDTPLLRREYNTKEKMKTTTGKIKEKDVIIVPLKNNKDVLLEPSEFEALCQIARGGKKAYVLKHANISGMKYNSLKKIVEELPPSLKKRYAELGNIEKEAQRRKKENEINYHNTARRWNPEKIK